MARFGPALIALALLAPVLAAPTAAHAEIIDFNPATDEVPEILEPAELARYEALSGDRFIYMYTSPNPGGTSVLAYHGQGVDFVNLRTGAIVPIAADPPIPGFELAQPTWMGDNLVSLNIEPQQDGSAKYYRVERNGLTGAVMVTPVEVKADGQVISVSPDLSTLLVMEYQADNPPPAKKVTLGPRYDGPEREPPPGIESLDELPGVVNRQPQRTLEVQQAGFNLLLQNLDGSNRRPLSSATAETALAGVSWSPDSRRVAIGMSTMPGWDGDRRRDNDPPPAGLPNLGSINVQEALGRVAPADNPLVTGTRIEAFATTGGPLRAFQNVDFQQGMLNQIVFSPTGKHALLSIATRSALGDRPNPTYAFPRGVEWHLLDANLQPIRKIELPGIDSLATAADFADDDHIVFTIADELDNHVLLHDVTAGSTRTIWDKPGGIFQALPSAAGVVFTHQTVDEPIELWMTQGWGSGADLPAVRQVTFFNTALRLASRVQWAPVSWNSGGQTLSGIYVYPETMRYPPTEPAPMVVWQQGGPGGQMTNDFGASVESPYSMLANFGIPVFVANAAGRNVQSPKFYADMAEGRNFGQLDIRQIKDGVDTLVRQGIADPEAVGITGCSYGGYFTLQSLRSFPGFYAAGNTQCTLADLTEEFTFGYTPFIAYLMGRAPMADPAEYVKDSPMYGTKDITTPTLIFHGTKDFLPVPLINNVHDQIEANGVDVRFLRAAGYGHGLGTATDANGNPIAGSNLSGQRYAFQLQLEFFREYVGTAASLPESELATVFLPAIHNGAEVVVP